MSVSNRTPFLISNTPSRNNLSAPFYWLINASEIGPGKSAVIGNNRFLFSAIHHSAIAVLTVSLISSVVVIHKIHRQWKSSSSKLDFPMRFPLYLAITDLLCGISHIMDHLYLVTTQTFPHSVVIKYMLSINLWVFFGYQQLMHASVAGYTYLRVVRHKQLNLGNWEWKLHLSWCSFLLAASVLFFFLDAFGNTGYWMGGDVKTPAGLVLGVIAALTSTTNAACTTLGYCRIRCTVEKMKGNLQAYKQKQMLSSTRDGSEKNHDNGTCRDNARQQSVASRCLTTYVWVAACLYCPLAILLWINVLFSIFLSVVEPVSCLLIGLVANSSGWANAYGYFHNQRLKKEKEEEKFPKHNFISIEKSCDSQSSSRKA